VLVVDVLEEVFDGHRRFGRIQLGHDIPFRSCNFDVYFLWCSYF
jgi:hypothetical protein